MANRIFRRPLLSVFAGLAVLIWQNALRVNHPELHESERLFASTGACLESAERFFYFHYYLGVLPVTSVVAPQVFSESGAKAFARDFGTSLRSDLNSPCAVGRMGDLARFFLLLPSAWWHGTPQKPSFVLVTSLLFQASLLLVLFSAFLNGMPWMGIATVILVGSDRFQIFEAYFRNNVFSIPISCCLLLLAALWKFLGPRSAFVSKGDWVAAVVCGCIVSFASAVRMEVLPLSASVVLAYALSEQAVKRRCALVFLFFASFAVSLHGYHLYLDHLQVRAVRLIEESKGIPYLGPAKQHHAFWHSVAAGLSDFGSDKGYAWNDLVLYEHERQEVERELGVRLELAEFYYRQSGDSGFYLLKPESLPAYNRAVRDRVISDIALHPSWWLEILAKRIHRILDRVTPIRVDLGFYSWSIFAAPWLILFLIGIVLMCRRAFYFKFVLFSLSLSVLPLLVFSDRGTTAYGIFHLILAAAACDAITVLAKNALRKVPRPVHPTA